MSIKRFIQWIGLKERLHKQSHKAPLVSEGEIWWASIGENVGYEIDGKSDLFSRPVIIYKKLARGFYFVIPTTTQEKTGSWFVNFIQNNRQITACLHQARSIDHRRLSNKLAEIDTNDFARVKHGFMKLYT